MIFGKRPQREKKVPKYLGTRKAIIKCILENQPDFKYCYGCEITPQCKRIRKQLGV